jgi:hypothetical protein
MKYVHQDVLCYVVDFTLSSIQILCWTEWSWILSCSAVTPFKNVPSFWIQLLFLVKCIIFYCTRLRMSEHWNIRISKQHLFISTHLMVEFQVLQVFLYHWLSFAFWFEVLYPCGITSDYCLQKCHCFVSGSLSISHTGLFFRLGVSDSNRTLAPPPPKKKGMLHIILSDKINRLTIMFTSQHSVKNVSCFSWRNFNIMTEF